MRRRKRIPSAPGFMLGRELTVRRGDSLMSAGMGSGAAALPPMPPEEMAALQALLGGGAPPVDPGAMPVDPAAMGAPPAMGGPIPGMPSTDPAMIAQLRAQDHAALDAAQDAAMQTAASMMGGMPPEAMGAPPLGGDPLAPPMPGMVPLGSPVGPDPMMGLPPELAAAFGGADVGGLEGENVSPVPGDEFADALGAY